MTTKEDWLFRAEHFRVRARSLDGQAAELRAEAARLRDLANLATTYAERSVEQNGGVK